MSFPAHGERIALATFVASVHGCAAASRAECIGIQALLLKQDASASRRVHGETDQWASTPHARS